MTMKIFYKTVLIMSLILWGAAYICAEEDKPTYKYGYKEGYKYGYKENNIEDKTTIRPGMELRKVGNVNMLVPEGAEIYYDKGRYVAEGFGEYAARNFKETGERLNKIEASLKSLNDEIENLRKTVEAIQQSAANTETQPPPAQK